MKKTIMLLCLSLIYSKILLATIINIPADQPTIQAGINVAVDEDTVLVVENTYFENINFNGKNITVGSLYLTTQDTTYISQTVIDGDQNGGSVVTFESGEDFTTVLTGFTITNGSGNAYGYGGGIICENSSSPNLVSLIIENNTVDLIGGGLHCNNSSPYLSNVTIRGNVAWGVVFNSAIGGGVSLMNNSNSIFENTKICGNIANGSGGGIYCSSSNPTFINVTIKENISNQGGGGGGIYFLNSNPVFDNDNRCNIYLNQAYYANDLYSSQFIDVIVDTFSVTNPTDYYASPIENINYDILHGIIIQTNLDLYVSTDGDNSNSGLNEQDPLKTIDYALSIIQVDSLNVHSIYLDSGTYSSTTNGEQFPIQCISYVNLYGSGENETVIDADYENSVIYFVEAHDLILEEITITKGSAASNGGGIFCFNSNPKLINITINENVAGPYSFGYGGGIYCYNSNPILENVTISNNSIPENGYGCGMYCYNSNPIMLDVTISSNSISQFPAYGGGIYCSGSNPSLVNVTLTDNSADLGGGIYCFSSSSIFVNCILWNDSPQEIYFHDSGPPNTITISYSDIQGGEEGIEMNDNGTVNWLEGNINTDPFFVDAGNGDYHLQADSPCINAGTAFFEWEGEVLVDMSEDEYVGIAPDMGSFEFENPAIPHIYSITDVPEDQGGFVYLNFTRSSHDTDSPHRSEMYTIERLDDDIWIAVLSLVAYGQNTYQTYVATLIDSSNTSNGLTQFRVIASMDEGIWISEVAQGYSVDNIAPTTPDGVNGSASNDIAELYWLPSPDEDFQYFAIYKSGESGNFPNEPFATTIDVVFIDEEYTTDIHYYVITAIDYAGNESEYSEELDLLPVGVNPNTISKITKLYGNYPNPFNPVTTILFEIGKPGKTQIKIYNIKGQLVETLVNEQKTFGSYSVVWDAKEFSSGLYMFKLFVGGKSVSVKKCLLLK